MVKAVPLIRSVESVEKEAKGRAQLTLLLRESKRKRKKKSTLENRKKKKRKRHTLESKGEAKNIFRHAQLFDIVTLPYCLQSPCLKTMHSSYKKKKNKFPRTYKSLGFK